MDGSQFVNVFSEVNSLEIYLFQWRYAAPGIWPVEDLEDSELAQFIIDLRCLSKECLCMRLRVNMLSVCVDLDGEELFLGRAEVIVLTRNLLFCCDRRLIAEYRELTLREREVIRLLEQIHVALIGAHFRTHPFESTVCMRDIRFW